MRKCSELIHIIREQGAYNNPSTITLATVKSASPLTVTMNGVDIDEDILLNADLSGKLAPGDVLMVILEGEMLYILAKAAGISLQ